MPNQQLITYIQQQLNQGYDINAIRQYLIRYGYNPNEVEEAIRYVYQPPKKKSVIDKKLFLYIIGGVLLLLLIILGVMIFSGGSEKDQSVSIDTRLDTKRIIPGGYIMFTTNVNKQGSGVPEIEHTLIGPDGRIIETIKIMASGTRQSTMRLPTDSVPGIYEIRTIASLGDRTDSTFFRFNVSSPNDPLSPEPSGDNITAVCPAVCEDYNQCTRGYCSADTGFRCVFEPIVPCCGNGICEAGENTDSCPSDCPASVPNGSGSGNGQNGATPETPGTIIPQPGGTSGQTDEELMVMTVWEKVDAVKDIAKTSPVEAQRVCESIEANEHRNQCFLNIATATGAVDYCLKINEQSVLDKCYSDTARSTGNKDLCMRISTESRRDNCYMFFVQAGDYTICSNLVNKYYQESCEALKTMETIKRDNPVTEDDIKAIDDINMEEIYQNSTGKFISN